MSKYDDFRKRYKPDAIKLLFIAESPPQSKDFRFFYNPVTNRFDSLFKSMMEVIFGKVDPENKEFYLNRFMEKGFFLIDAVDVPVNRIKDNRERNRIIINNVPNKLNEISTLINTKTPIILIKKNVFEILHKPLTARGFTVLNSTFIPFPLYSNNVRRFKELLTHYLKIFYNDFS